MPPFDLDDLSAFAKKVGVPAAVVIASLWTVAKLAPDSDVWRCQVPQRTQSQILDLVANGDMNSDEAIRMAESFRDHGYMCRAVERQYARLSNEIRSRHR